MGVLRKGAFSLAILVDGRELPVYEHNGAYWIAGEVGKSYAIRVRPHTIGRLLVLQSVDGRNVLRDEAASLDNHGMVITHEWTNFGWRIDDEHTRDFVFGNPENSIAAQATGSTAGVGVIGVAVYEEKVHYPPPVNWGGSLLRGGAGGQSLGDVTFESMAVKSMLSADMGTGMGASRDSHVGHTSFQRGAGPILLEVQYRSREWLVANGIIGPELPKAFPGTATGYGNYRLEE